MKKIITAFSLLFVLIIQAQTVSINGTSYGTITEAITAANENDVIMVSGIHTEAITISKSITLKGTDPTTDIIQEASSPSTSGSGTGTINVIRAEDTDVLTVTIENLGIRNGNSAENGGGVNIDKVTGKLILRNLIIENNSTAKNGGGLSIVGSNAEVKECTIRNNSSSLDGGGIIFASNNGASTDTVISLQQSLIDSNTGRNGGGIFINGNKGFGDNFKINTEIVNTTISNNTTFSAGSGAGGGAIWTRTADYLGAGGGSNVTLKMVHATVYNNSHASDAKTGLQFTKSSGASASTNFSIYNSIVVSADLVAKKALNFANTNTTDVVNCILGGLNAAPASIVDDANKNNSKGKTATFAGISALSDEGGATQVLAFGDGSNSDDYCTATTGITLPNVDQRGAVREGVSDAGAFEFGGTLSTKNFQSFSTMSIYPNPSDNVIYIKGIDNIEIIQIFSVLGALELEINNKNFFDVKALSKGIHFAKVKSNKGIFSSQFVVK